MVLGGGQGGGGVRPVTEEGHFYFYLLLSKVVSLLQLTTDCVLLQWGRIQKQPLLPPVRRQGKRQKEPHFLDVT